MTNITRHITDRQNIITSRFSIIMLCFSIITLSLLNITFLTGAILGIPISTVSALSYQNSTDVSFTFDPILSISVSPDSITVPTIAPGTTDTSNTITVNVSTNTAYGYSLLASVGNNTDYNTSDLVHSSSTIDSTFTSIATNASLPQLDTDNTWGYSFSSNHGATWSTYHGLPLYSTVDNNTSTTSPALLIDTKSPADSKSIDFRIAARASSTQPSGTYSNVINFYAVGKPKPPVSMQDTATIKTMLTDVGDEMEVMDDRDGNVYWIARQADDNIWMTQNLDLCIGCEGTAALTSQNTDLNEAGGSVYYSGYTENNGIITWTPVNTAVSSGYAISNSIVSPGFEDGYSGLYSPYSAEGGDTYVYTSNGADNDIIYTSLAECSAFHSAGECSHYHVGNYYNWSAAIASNSSSNKLSNPPTASNSICPSGWKLPQESTNIHEFGQLFFKSGIIENPTANSYIDDGLNRLRSPKLYFVRSGIINGNMLEQRSGGGNYWSGSYYDRYINAYNMYFDNDAIRPAVPSSRNYGFSIRCLLP